MSDIIAIRVPKELKKKLKELGIKYSDEVRKFLVEIVKRETARRSVSRAMEIQKKVKKLEGNLAADFIREDRDGR